MVVWEVVAEDINPFVVGSRVAYFETRDDARRALTDHKAWYLEQHGRPCMVIHEPRRFVITTPEALCRALNQAAGH